MNEEIPTTKKKKTKTVIFLLFFQEGTVTLAASSLARTSTQYPCKKGAPQEKQQLYATNDARIWPFFCGWMWITNQTIDQVCFIFFSHECLLPLAARRASGGVCCFSPSGLVANQRRPLGSLQPRRAKHVDACVHLLVTMMMTFFFIASRTFFRYHHHHQASKGEGQALKSNVDLMMYQVLCTPYEVLGYDLFSPEYWRMAAYVWVSINVSRAIRDYLRSRVKMRIFEFHLYPGRCCLTPSAVQHKPFFRH